MTERREIKQRSPAVWAKVREAYLAGEPAASVARRFDVGYGNLRFRAHAEGWTRKATMVEAEVEAADEDLRLAGQADRNESGGPGSAPVVEVDPRAAIATTLRRAAGLLVAGRGAEATAMLKAVETLSRLTGSGPLCSADPQEEAPRVLTREEDAKEEAEARATFDAVNIEVERRAGILALQLLGDIGHSDSNHGAFALRWRAEVLGPEAAAADRERAERGGWAERYWDEDGALRPRADVADGLWRYMRGAMRAHFGLPGSAPDDG